MSFSFTYPYPAPSTKGWGPGWPNCQRDKVVPHGLFIGGVHEELLELVNLLVAEAERRGFVFISPGCWGFGCRPKKRADGSLSDEPSVHSWALSLDINAPRNVFGAAQSSSEIATKFPWLVDLFREYGFFWLGPPISDWMHFHFAGDREDARMMTEKARRDFENTEEDEMFEQWREGWEAHEDGKDVKPSWPNMKKEGWRARNKLLAEARSGDPE